MPHQESKRIPFSIIIPTRNRSKMLLQTLRCLENQTYPRKDFEVIVVVNGSTDQTKQVLEKFSTQTKMRLKHVFEDRLGPSFARNRGIKDARHEHCIFVDDDIDLDPDFLERYDRAWKKYPDAKMIGGKVLAVTPVDHPKKEELIQKHPWCFGQIDLGMTEKKFKMGGFLISANMSVRLDKEERRGLFKESLGVGLAIMNTFFFGGEDYELTCRFVLKKERVMYVPSIVVKNNFHPFRLQRKYLIKRYFFAALETYIIDTSLKKDGLQKQLFFRNQLYTIVDDLKNFQLARIVNTHLHHFYDVVFYLTYFFVAPIIFLDE